jgi:hypothetical protein
MGYWFVRSDRATFSSELERLINTSRSLGNYLVSMAEQPLELRHKGVRTILKHSNLE